MSEQWSEEDIPDQTGRVAVVTGANTGLGLETARALAGRGATVILAVRNLDKGSAAIAAIHEQDPTADLILQQLDLSSLDSIRTAASSLSEELGSIDLLINNAGVMFTPRESTADGFEMQFGTNHLGHFAWTGLLIDKMVDVPGSRVVTVSSQGHRMASAKDFDDPNAERGYNRVSAYGRSKLANLLFTYELQRRLQAADAMTVALAAHPGGSNTELSRHIPFSQLMEPISQLTTQSAAMGALPTLRAATDPGAEGGQYYGPDGLLELRGHPVLVQSSSQSYDEALQQQLWQTSEELTGVRFPL